MTAIFFGSGTGIERNLSYYLGARAEVGDPGLGRGGDAVRVNAANGNLLIQNTDEVLIGRGPDSALGRSYNSQGTIAGETDNWWQSTQRKIEYTTPTKAINGSGSKFTLTDWDGTVVDFTYVNGQGFYQTGNASYADDRLVIAGSILTWTDGKTGTVQRYQYFATQRTARLISVADADGNTINYEYDSTAVTGKLTKITTAIGTTGVAGQEQGQTNFTTVSYWAGTNNVKAFTTYWLDKSDPLNPVARSLSRTAYAYDSANRLTKVTVDLTPDDLSTADGKSYVTTYGYDGASRRIALITQSDGSSLAVSYDASGRVIQLTQAVDGASSRTTVFTYTAAGQIASYTDALGKTTMMQYDALGRVTRIEESAASLGGNARITRIAYDTLTSAATASLGIVTASSDISLYDGAANEAAGIYLTREYRRLDNDKNLLEQGSIVAGNAGGGETATIVRRSYANNLLLRETTYIGLDSDGAGLTAPSEPLTARYVYDAERHLRFMISATGRVTEYGYDASGQLISTLSYGDQFYPVAALAETAVLTESQLNSWVNTITNKSGAARTDTLYDFRGNILSVTAWAQTLADGTGDPAAGRSRTVFAYDQYGNLLSRQVEGSSQSEVFVYDGLGRVISATDLTGTVSTITIADSTRITTISTPGLADRKSHYDLAGQLTSTSIDGATTRFEYDRLGRLRISTDATGVSRYSIYDRLDRKIADIDADGSVVEYRYDSANRLVASIAHAVPLDAGALATLADLNSDPTLAGLGLQSAAQDRWSWSIHDRAGRLVQTIDATGAITDLAYDGAGRLIATTSYANRLDAAVLAVLQGTLPTAALAATASADDRTARNFYDADGLLIASLDGEGALVEHSYDAMGRRIRSLAHATLTDPALRSAGSLAALIASAVADAKDIASHWFYDGRGLVLATVDGEGQVSRFGYDARGDVISVQRGEKLAGGTARPDLALASGIAIELTSYTRRADGQISTMVQGLSSGQTITSYSYDALGRLAGATVANTPTSEVRSSTNRYDARGRLIGTLGGEASAALAALGSNPSEAALDALYQERGTRYFYDAADRLIATSQPEGAAGGALLLTRYYYDTDGSLRFTINPNGEVSEYRFNSFRQQSEVVVYGGTLTSGELATLSGGLIDGALMAAISALQSRTAGLNSLSSQSYNNRGELTSSTDPLNFTSLFEYNSFGELRRTEQVSDAFGGAADITLLNYDRRGLVKDQTRLLGGSSTGAIADSFGYDAFGRLVSQQTNLDGRALSYSYDRNSRVKTSTDRTGAIESFDYDARGNQISHTDRSGRITQFQYDLFNRTVTTTTQQGIVTKVTRNAQGQTIRIIDGALRETSYSYDRNGNLRFAADAASTTETRYDLAQRVADVIDARGVRTHYAYDPVGRVLSRTDNADAIQDAPALTTRWEYDAKGQQVKIIDPAGVETHVSYDLRGQQVKLVRDATGLAIETRFTIGAGGQVQTQIDGWGTPAQRSTSYSYDTLGRLISMTEDAAGPDARTTSYSWDENGNLVASTDGQNRVTRFVYDRENRQIFSVNAEGEVVETGYDGAGRAIWTQAYATRIPLATLDGQPLALGEAQLRGLLVSSSNDRVSTMAFDGDGRLQFTVDAEGYVTRNRYDDAGNLIKTTRYATKFALARGASAGDISAAVLAAGNAGAVSTGYEYDGANRLFRITDALNVQTRYVLDALGQIIETHVADGTDAAAITTRSFDALGRLRSETRAAGTSYAVTMAYGYDELGRVTSMTDARGAVITRDYDGLGRLLSEIRPLNSGETAITSFSYDARGNVVRTIDPRGNASYAYYDGLDRLVLQIDQEGYATRTDYSVGGAVASVARFYNRATGTGSLTSEPTVTADAQGRDATTQFTRDRTDRIIATIDALNASESYTLNAFGDRIVVTNKLGGITRYDYDHRGLVTREAVDASTDGSSPAFVRNEYVYDARGNLKQQIEAPGQAESRTTSFEYDALDRLIEKTGAEIDGAGVPVERYSYDLRGNLVRVEDPTGAKITSWFDDLGRKVAEVSPVGTYTDWTYDPNGNVTRQRVYSAALTGTPALTTEAPLPPAGAFRETQFDYDAANRQIRARAMDVRSGRMQDGAYVVTAAGSYLETSKDYDAAGNVIRETDANGGIMVQYFDGLGRAVAKVDAGGFVTRWTRDTDGNVQSERRYASALAAPVDPRGSLTLPGEHADDRLTTFSYDRNGRRTQLVRWGLNDAMNGATGALTQGVQSTINYEYNGFDEVTAKIEANGDRTDYHYDQFGRLVTQLDAAITDFSGATVRKVTDYSYDALNNVTRTVERDSANAQSRTTLYSYIRGRLSQVHDAGNYDRFYGYDLAGRLTRESWARVDSLGAATEEASVTQHDAAGRVSRQYKAIKSGGSWVQASISTELTYNAFGELASRAIAGVGGVAQIQEWLEYDNAGRVIRTNSGDGVVKLLAYDANGNATLTITSHGRDLSGAELFATIASLGNVVQTTADDVTVTISVYDARNLGLASIEPNRSVATNNNDVVTVAHGVQVMRSRSYNAFGEVVSETDARGNVTSFAYNTMGRMVRKVAPQVEVTDERGAKTQVTPTERYFYDAAGRMVGSRDANGNLTYRELLAGSGHGEGEGLVAVEHRADGSVWRTGYDVFGQMRRGIDGLSRVTSYGYDGLGRLTSILRPSGSVTEYFAYDILGQRTQRWNSVQTVAVYDYENPIVEYDEWRDEYVIIGYPVINNVPLVERTDYDVEGRVVSVTTYGGDTTTTSYAWESGYANTALGLNGGWRKITSYDSGRTEEEQSDGFGHVLRRKDQGNHWYTMSYTRAGQLASQHGVGTGSDVAYSYDISGRLIGLEQFIDRTVFHRIIREIPGEPDSGGTITRITTITDLASYSYDADGNRLAEKFSKRTDITETGSPWLLFEEETFSSSTRVLQNSTAQFDALNRMTRFKETGEGGNGRVTITNQYDANGNVRRTRSTYQTFDGAGNLSASDSVQDYWYRYDAMNRFVVVKGSLNGSEGSASAFITLGLGNGLEYDAAGQRVAMTSDAVQYDGNYDPDTDYSNGQGNFLGANFNYYQQSLTEGVNTFGWIGSNFSDGETTFLAASLINEEIIDDGEGGGGGGGVSFPYYDSALQGTWYVTANGLASYVVLGDTGGGSGTHGGLTPPALLDVYDAGTGGTWSYVSNGTDGWGNPAGYYTLALGGGSGTNPGTGGGVATFSGSLYYTYLGGTPTFSIVQSLTLPADTGYGSGEIIVSQNGGQVATLAAGATTVVLPPYYFNSADPAVMESTAFSATYVVHQLVNGSYVTLGQGTVSKLAGSQTITGSSFTIAGTGGGTGYPYYSAAAGGTIYRAQDGVTEYLVPGDTGGSAGIYGGLAVPGIIPSLDPVTGGAWLYQGGQLVLDMGLGSEPTYPYYDAGAGGTYYLTAQGATLLVVGDSSGGTAAYQNLTPPTVIPQFSSTLNGSWYNNGASGFRLVLGDRSGGFTPYLDDVGVRYAFAEARGTYVYAGDSTPNMAHSGLQRPPSFPYYDAAAGGTWTRELEIDPESGTHIAILTFTPGANPNLGGVYSPLYGGTIYRAANGVTEYIVYGDTSGASGIYGGRVPTNINGGPDPVTGDNWYYDYIDLDTGVVQLLVYEPGNISVPTYPYYDPAAGGTRYLTAQGAVFLVVGDTSGGNPAYLNLTPPAVRPVFSSALNGSWYSDASGLRFVPGDRTGGFTPYYDGYSGVWYKAADSQQTYLFAGDVTPNLAHSGLTIPASFPARDEALGGTWSAIDYGYGYVVISFTPDPSYPFYDASAGGTRYLAGDGTPYLVVGDTSGSLGVYAGEVPPAARPGFDAAGRGVWLDSSPLGLRLQLGAQSYYAPAAGGTYYRRGDGSIFLVVGDSSGTLGLYAGVTVPATFPAWDAGGAGTWYNDGPLGVRLVVGDTSAQPLTLSRTRERYGYNLDGYLEGVYRGTSVWQRSNGVETLLFVGGESLVSATSYDGLGRITGYAEYSGGQQVFSRYAIQYNGRGQITAEASNLVRGGDNYGGSVSNYYDASGLLLSSSSTSTKNGGSASTSITSSTYAFWDSAVQLSVSYRPDVTKPETYLSSYSYDLLGRLKEVKVNDGRPRTISFTNDAAGQVLARVESSTAASNPRSYYTYFGGIQIGTNSNNGNDDPGYDTAIQERITPPPTTPGPFRNGASGPSAYAQFDRSFDAITAGGQQAGPATHTVRAGETLQGIAAQQWGDASLWYLLAEANGLSAGSSLAAGQVLTVPNKVANFHNNADTFRPYDAAGAIGDTQPTTPKPPKKPKCGIIGQILLVAIAIAVTLVLKAPITNLLGGVFGGATGAVGAGLAAGAGSIVSQGVGVATGIQESFSWKAVGLAAIGGAVGAGLPGGEIIKGAGQLINDVVRGALSNAITQGVGVATGLQDKFSWKSVAIGGVVGGVSGVAARGLGVGGADFTPSSFGDYVRVGLSGLAGGIAGAATKSAIDGTNFGDNLLATLPDVLGSVLGQALGSKVNQKIALDGAARATADLMLGGLSNFAASDLPEDLLPLVNGEQMVITAEMRSDIQTFLADKDAVKQFRADVRRTLKQALLNPSPPPDQMFGGGDIAPQFDLTGGRSSVLDNTNQWGAGFGGRLLGGLRQVVSWGSGQIERFGQWLGSRRNPFTGRTIAQDTRRAGAQFRRLERAFPRQAERIYRQAEAIGEDIIVRAGRKVDSIIAQVSQTATAALSDENVGRVAVRSFVSVVTGNPTLGQMAGNSLSPRNTAAVGRATKDFAISTYHGVQTLAELASPLPNQTKAEVGMSLVRAATAAGNYTVSRVSSPSMIVSDAQGVVTNIEGRIDRFNAMDPASQQEALFYWGTRGGLEVATLFAGVGEIKALGNGARGLRAVDDLVIAGERGVPEFITVFRGDRAGTTIIKSNAAREGGYASSQRIIESNNLDDLFRSHALDSSSPPSPFISVTTDPAVARYFAGPNGVVNEFRIPLSRATANPFNGYVVPAGPSGRLISEAEFLVPNYIRSSEFVRKP